MANITLAWNNRADEGTLSGGSWLASLPLSNLQNRQVQKVARSSNLLADSTRFNVDLGQPRTVGVLGLVVHNISVTGQVRLMGSDAPLVNASTLDPANPALWVKLAVTTTAGAINGADGQPSGVRCQATSSGALLVAAISTATATSGQIVAYVKQGSGATSANYFSVDVGGSTNIRFRLNYSTGAITYEAGSGVTATNAGDGWWRLNIPFTASIGDGVNFYSFFNSVFSTATPGDFAYLFWPEIFFGGSTIYDSDWGDVWPAGMIPQGLLEWEDDNFWLGTLSANARAGYQSPFLHLLPLPKTLRYWRVEIADASNADGYVQVGRLFMAATWVPSVNYAYGAGLGYEDPTLVDRSLSGAEYFDVRSRFRVFQFELQFILNSEAYAYALELQRIAGTSGEVLVIPDRDDAINQPARAFVGRLLQLGRMTQPQPTAFTCAFQIKELL